jgi:hypothetical protein
MRIVNMIILVDTPYAYIDTWWGSNIQPLVGNVQIFHTWNRMVMGFFVVFCVFFPFFRFVDKWAIYRWYNLIRTCAGECDWLFHWQHKLCATFSANVNINYRLPIKVHYGNCTPRHIRIEINHGSQNVFWVLTWVGGY